jgi:hypothetical protein
MVFALAGDSTINKFFAMGIFSSGFADKKKEPLPVSGLQY